MRKLVIFSEKYDYLLIAAGLGVVLWSFYGIVPAVIAATAIIAVVNLQPVRQSAVPATSSAMLVTAFVLLLSIVTKLIDRDGYCYAFFGPERGMADGIGILMPCFPGEDFYSNTGQAGGMGYVRDVGLPLLGLILGLFVVRNVRNTDDPAANRKLYIGIAFALALLWLLPPAIHFSGLGRVIEPVNTKTIEELERELEKASEARD